MKNKYVRRSRISEAKFRQIVKLFSLDLTAAKITEIVGLNPTQGVSVTSSLIWGCP